MLSIIRNICSTATNLLKSIPVNQHCFQVKHYRRNNRNTTLISKSKSEGWSKCSSQEIGFHIPCWNHAKFWSSTISLMTYTLDLLSQTPGNSLFNFFLPFLILILLFSYLLSVASEALLRPLNRFFVTLLLINY